MSDDTKPETTMETGKKVEETDLQRLERKMDTLLSLLQSKNIVVTSVPTTSDVQQGRGTTTSESSQNPPSAERKMHIKKLMRKKVSEVAASGQEEEEEEKPLKDGHGFPLSAASHSEEENKKSMLKRTIVPPRAASPAPPAELAYDEEGDPVTESARAFGGRDSRKNEFSSHGISPRGDVVRNNGEDNITPRKKFTARKPKFSFQEAVQKMVAQNKAATGPPPAIAAAAATAGGTTRRFSLSGAARTVVTQNRKNSVCVEKRESEMESRNGMTNLQKKEDDTLLGSSTLVKLGSNEEESKSPFSPSAFSDSNFDSNLESSTASTFSPERDRRQTIKDKHGASKKKKEKTVVSQALDEKLISAFDLCYVMSSLITCILVVSFIHPKMELIDDTPHGAYIAWMVLLNIITWSWMAMRSRIPFFRKWEIVDDPAEVRKHYLKTWFGLDVICAIPVEFIFISWANPIFYYVSTRHFLRLFRVVSLGAGLNPLSQQRQGIIFAFYCMIVVLVAHVIACIFWSVEPSGLSYVESLYWAVATMTSVGYGDIAATSNNARIYAIFGMFCGIVLLSSLTAFATSFLTSKDPLVAELDQKKSMLEAMLKHYEIPWNVQKEVIAMFPSVLDVQSEAQFHTLLEGLPPFVRSAIDRYINARLLNVVPIFQKLKDREVVAQLASCLTQHFCPAFEYIIFEGEQGDEMYFLMKGIVDVLVSGVGWGLEEEDEGAEDDVVCIATLRSGSYFGEIALFDQTVRTATVQAVTPCELMVLKKEDFMRVMESSPELRREVTGAVKQRNEQRRASVREFLDVELPKAPRSREGSESQVVTNESVTATTSEVAKGNKEEEEDEKKTAEKDSAFELTIEDCGGERKNIRMGGAPQMLLATAISRMKRSSASPRNHHQQQPHDHHHHGLLVGKGHSAMSPSGRIGSSRTAGAKGGGSGAIFRPTGNVFRNELSDVGEGHDAGEDGQRRRSRSFRPKKIGVATPVEGGLEAFSDVKQEESNPFVPPDDDI